MISRIASVSTLCLVALFAVGTPPVRADEIDDSIAKLVEAAKAKDERETIKWMVKLQDKTDARVGAAFLKLTTNKNEKIAVAAYQKSAARKNPKLLKKLPGLIKNKKLLKKKPKVYVAVLKAAGEYGNKKTREPLAKVVQKHMAMRPQFAVPAILSFGRERVVENIETMLKWADVANPSTGGSGASISTETRDNYAKASTAIFDALNELTGMDMGDPTTFKAWWEKKKKGYKLPDPDKVNEPIDFSKLREHTDSYGFSVKLPPGEVVLSGEGENQQKTGWMMVDPDPDDGSERFSVSYMSKNEHMAAIHFMIYNASRESIKTKEAFVEWWITDWKNNQFDPETIKVEPEVKQMKINGRDVAWAEATGISAGNRKGWGPAHRRIYVAKMNHLLLYMFVDIKTGAEPEIRAQTIEIIEKMKFDD